MTKRSDLTVVVAVRMNESNQELIEDLMARQPRARAERLRVLAMLGLIALKGGGGNGVTGHSPTTPPLRLPPRDEGIPSDATAVKTNLKGKTGIFIHDDPPVSANPKTTLMERLRGSLS